MSAFGGVIACNYKINTKIALEITKNFIEVLMAKGFDKDSLKILKKKLQREGVFKVMREKRHHEKPSEKKLRKSIEARKRKRKTFRKNIINKMPGVLL